MKTPWVPRTAPSIDSPEAEIRSMSWEESQEWCNFVLMKPTLFPAGVSLETAEMRPESPPGRRDGAPDSRLPSWTLSNRACHRSVLAGKGRRLRIKQYLYDWAPPAFDCPSLWQSPVVRHFSVGSDVGWLGTDFRGLPGASVSLDRTMIELSVLDGSFSDDELEQICRDLRPVNSEARNQILHTPLATLSYPSRHSEIPIAVPVGFWAHERKPESVSTHVFPTATAPPDLPGADIGPPSDYGYELNSVFAYGDVAHPDEADFVYYRSDRPNLYIRVLASLANPERAGMRYPPAPDRQPCQSEIISIAGKTVYYAFINEDVGPHEVVYQADGLNVMLLVKPAEYTNRSWFVDLLSRILGAGARDR
jgi:hypothetical protein